MDVLTKEDERFLEGLGGPSHWSDEEGRRVVELLDRSGESRASFAHRYGIKASRLAFWQRRFAGLEVAASPAAATAAWVELVGVASSSSAIAARVRIGEIEVELARLDDAAARFIVALGRETIR